MTFWSRGRRLDYRGPVFSSISNIMYVCISKVCRSIYLGSGLWDAKHATTDTFCRRRSILLWCVTLSRRRTSKYGPSAFGSGRSTLRNRRPSVMHRYSPRWGGTIHLEKFATLFGRMQHPRHYTWPGPTVSPLIPILPSVLGLPHIRKIRTPVAECAGDPCLTLQSMLGMFTLFLPPSTLASMFSIPKTNNAQGGRTPNFSRCDAGPVGRAGSTSTS